MKQRFIPLTLFTLSFIFFAACNPPNSAKDNPDLTFLKQIYSVDDEALGSRSKIKSELIEGTKSMFQVPMSDEHIGFCDCMLDNVLPKITKEQYEEVLRKNYFAPSLTPEFLACAQKYADGYSKEWIPNTDNKESNVKACIAEATVAAAGQATKEQIEDYCTCVMEKIYSKGYSFNVISEFGDETSEVFQNVILPCQQVVFQ